MGKCCYYLVLVERTGGLERGDGVLVTTCRWSCVSFSSAWCVWGCGWGGSTGSAMVGGALEQESRGVNSAGSMYVNSLLALLVCVGRPGAGAEDG